MSGERPMPEEMATIQDAEGNDVQVPASRVEKVPPGEAQGAGRDDMIRPEFHDKMDVRASHDHGRVNEGGRKLPHRT